LHHLKVRHSKVPDIPYRFSKYMTRENLVSYGNCARRSRAQKILKTQSKNREKSHCLKVIYEQMREAKPSAENFSNCNKRIEKIRIMLRLLVTKSRGEAERRKFLKLQVKNQQSHHLNVSHSEIPDKILAIRYRFSKYRTNTGHAVTL
jgi:hypothetical protein